MSDMVQNLICQIHSSRQTLLSISALDRLSSHEAVLSCCQDLQNILSNLDWEAQHETMSDISYLLRTYQCQSFVEFCRRLSSLMRDAKKASRHAKQAAESLAAAGQECNALTCKVGKRLEQQKQDAIHHGYWAEADRGTANGFKLAGHIIGPFTLGLGYLFWTGSSTYSRKAETHCQELQVLQDVSSVLQNKVQPVIAQHAAALEAAAEFFDNLVIDLEHMQKCGRKASDAAASDTSELQMHYEDMRDIMGELNLHVKDLLVASRRAQRQIQSRA